jgi:hypothetical protein
MYTDSKNVSYSSFFIQGLACDARLRTCCGLRNRPQTTSTAHREQTDPYAIAMARELEASKTFDNRDICVVTQARVLKESEKDKKIPGVC